MLGKRLDVKPGRVLCSPQRRKVTIFLAEEVSYRSRTSLESVLMQAARLLVALHHSHGTHNLVEGVLPGRHCDHFLLLCPGKPQTRSLANVLIRWTHQRSGGDPDVERVEVFRPTR